MNKSDNPLLDFADLPRFAEVRPEHVTPAVEQLLCENRELIAKLLASADIPAWDNFMLPLDDANERLSRAWGQVAHLNAVMNSPELREVYNANLSRVTQYYAELGQNLNEALKEKYMGRARATPVIDEGEREAVKGMGLLIDKYSESEAEAGEVDQS